MRFEALSIPQKSEGNALQPSPGSEIFRHRAVGSWGLWFVTGV